MFNDIKVLRKNKAGETLQTIAVPIEYGPRNKTLTRILQNPDLMKPVSVIVPTMSFEITSIQRNPKLQTDKNMTWYRQSAEDSDKLYSQWQSIPYTLGFQLSIYVKNAYDGFQIIEQILPYFAPEWSVTANLVPQMDYREDIKITLDQITLNDDAETSAITEGRVIVWTLNFSLQMPFFGPVAPTGIIKRVFVNFYVPPGSGEVTDGDIANTDIYLTYDLVPGRTANGEPTTDVRESIAYSLIKSEDSFGFAETWIDHVDNTVTYTGSFPDSNTANSG